MSDDTESTTPPRAGSSADLVRRMDRMEQKHEELAKEVAGLTATVGRVEQNQTHAEELNKLRFESQKTALDTLTSTVGAFISRIDGIISGEIETAQSRQGKAIFDAYVQWQASVERRLDPEQGWRGEISDRMEAMEVSQKEAAATKQGMAVVLTGTKALILTAAAIASPVVALIVALSR